MFDAVRRPEYTGENRCWPCTLANAAVVCLLALIAGARWPPAAVAVLAVGGGAVAFRGTSSRTPRRSRRD